MSGGYFDYENYRLNDIADRLESLVALHDEKRLPEYYANFSEKTYEIFRQTVIECRKLERTLHHIDYLLEGDHVEDTFLKRMNHD